MKVYRLVAINSARLSLGAILMTAKSYSEDSHSYSEFENNLRQ